MRGGDDDSSGEAMLAREIGDARRRDHAGAQHLGAAAREPRGDDRGNPGAGLARVRAQQHLRCGKAFAAEGVRQCEARGKDRFSVEGRLSGHRANAIGSKKFFHASCSDFLSTTRLVRRLLENRVVNRLPSCAANASFTKTPASSKTSA